MPDTLVRPAHLWVPEHTSTAGAEAADLAASAGITLDPEQRLALDAILAEKADGKWAAFEAAVIAARQNLKTFVFQVVVLADLFLFDSGLVVWSAHEFNTAMEAFRDFKILFDANPHLARRIDKTIEGNGEEGFEFYSGQRLRFKARTKSGGRGLTADRVILDEAFALTPKIMGSLMPTMSARSILGNPQILYGSSAGMVTSDVLRGVRDRGRAGNDPSLAYVEWCAPVTPCADDRCDHRVGSPGCVLDDPEMWRRANPAMDRRISRSWIEGERRSMTPDEFARERLGWWEEPSSAVAGLPLHVWEGAAHEGRIGSPLGYAADVTPDLSWASIVRASACDLGTVLELVAHRRGTSWVAEELAALRGDASTPVALDLGSPASVLADDLAAAGIPTVNPSARDVAQACSGLLDGLIRRNVWHVPSSALDAAVRGASRRPMGDAWAWSRKNSLVDISPLVAGTLARWVTTQVEEPAAPFLIVT